MSEISQQKVKEHLTVPVWLDLELNSQDQLILWNAIKAIHAIHETMTNLGYSLQKTRITTLG